MFKSEIDSTVQSFKKTISSEFKRTLDMFRGYMQGNSFMSVYQTNWKFTVLQTKLYSPVYTNPITYNGSCSCGTSAQCSEFVQVNGTIINGLVIGCYPLESILQSSLECLYNQTCLDLIYSYFGEQPQHVSFNVLSSINQHGVNEKVQQMVDRLFVDQWYANDSYQNYSQQCRPTFCTYSYTQNFDIAYIVTGTLGLYSGLSTALQLIVPLITHIIFRLFFRERTHVTPTS